MDNVFNDDQTSDKQNKEDAQAADSSSYKENIQERINEKASKFQSVLMNIEHKAEDFLDHIHNIVRKNHLIREYLKSMKNYYVNYFFNYFGYRYESIIENPNFFHFISQAWLVNAF